jgi:hypothetical protein
MGDSVGIAPAVGHQAKGLAVPPAFVPSAAGPCAAALPVIADIMRVKEAIVSGSAAIARNWSCQRSRYRFAKS